MGIGAAGVLESLLLYSSLGGSYGIWAGFAAAKQGRVFWAKGCMSVVERLWQPGDVREVGWHEDGKWKGKKKV
jgi:hypothetical protein